MARTRTIYRNRASRASPAPCGPPSRSIRARTEPFPRQRDRSAANPGSLDRSRPMAVYSVHLPGDSVANVSEAAFVREGFSAAAFFFGPLWLLWRGLWLWAVVWLAGFIALWGLTGAGVLSSSARL